MALPDEYLKYPMRRYGNDHDHYDWSMLHDRAPIQWPNGKSLAVWVNTSVQFFPLNQRGIPFKVPYGMAMPYPDLRHYSLRDYGNRVGLYRFFKAFERYNIKPTYAVSAQLANDNPYLLAQLLDQDAELICHGWNMDHLHYGGQDINEEAEIVSRAVNTLRDKTKRDIRGWLSPARNQSAHTPELLRKAGIEYCCDWVNDDLPYAFNTPNGPLTMLPLQTEIEDAHAICGNLHSEDAWVVQVIDAIDYLVAEAKQQKSGRMLGLSLHPWLTGQPHRIGCLEQILDYINQHDDIWQASAAEIIQHSGVQK
ncbi:polysaccharide deacetylase family protein [Reinekea forsetii]|nr:polysaccharide deacetylase family protein [Reinekea forsetii]